jgi:hypothetical protein
MLRASHIPVASLIALLGACSLSVEGTNYNPGGGGGGSVSSSVGAGAGSSVSSASASASASSANTGSEDCFDNEDTDGDGAVDCDDPDCAPVAACAPVPKDWALVRTGKADPNGPAGKCADGSTTGTLYFKDPAGAPGCTACDCGPPAQAVCTAPEISCYYGSNNCGGAPDFKVTATSNQCVELSNNVDPAVNIPGGSHTPGSCRLTGPATLQAPGSCLATGGEVMPAPLWASAVLVCPEVAEAGGCAGDARCVPTPEGSICIARDGDHACPKEWSVKTTAFLSGQDARSCTPCACEVGCSGGKYIVRDIEMCMDSHDPVTVDSDDCVTAPNIFDYDDTSLNPTVATPMLEACPGGAGEGQVNPQDQQTICCRE